MSSIGDLTVGISCDPSDLTAGMTQVRSEIDDTVSTLEKFKSTAVSAARAAQSAITTAAKSIANDLYTVAHGAIVSVGQEMTEMALKTALLGASVGAASSYFVGFTNTLRLTWTTFRVGLTVSSWFLPWLKAATVAMAAISVATYAYRGADEYLNGELTKSIVHVSQMKDAWSNLKQSLDETRESLVIVADGMGSIGAQAAKITVDVTGVSSVMGYLDRVAAGTMNSLAFKLHATNEGFKSFTGVVTDSISTTGASAAELRKLGAETASLTAKQLASADMFGQLAATQKAAAEQGAHNAELARIASLTSIDAIKAETTALQEKNGALIAGGKATEQTQKNAAALFLALANQKNAVESGKMEKSDKASPADSVLRSAREALDVLVMGRDRAAVAALRAAGGTDDEVRALQELQKQIAGVTRLEDEKKKLDDKVEADLKAREQLQKQGIDRIASMKDQVDLLNGSATKAEIAMREMTRQGFGKEQVDEVGKLTKELDRLQGGKGGKKTDAGREPDKLSEAVTAGSKESLSIIAKASTSAKDPLVAKADMQIKEQQKGNGLLAALPERINRAIQFQVADIA